VSDGKVAECRLATGPAQADRIESLAVLAPGVADVLCRVPLILVFTEAAGLCHTRGALAVNQPGIGRGTIQASSFEVDDAGMFVDVPVLMGHTRR